MRLAVRALGMTVGAEHALREAYRATRPAAIRTGLRNAIVLAVCGAPLFFALDRARNPELTSVLLALRLGDSIVQLTFLWLVLRPGGERRVWLIGVLGPAVAALATNVMAALTGGLASVHSAGNAFIILCTAILIPWSPAWMLLVSLAVIGTAVPVALVTGPPGDPHTAALALGGLGAIVMIAVACSALGERARWRGFRSQHALAEYSQLLEAIGRAQSSFIAETEPRVLFAELLQNILAVTGSAHGFIGEILRHADGTPFLQMHTITDISGNETTRQLYEATARTGFRFENLHTLFGAALVTGEPVIANAPATDPRRGGLPPGHPPLDAFLGLPLYHGEQLVGLVGVANRAGGYDRALVDRLAPLARTVAGLIWAQRSATERRHAEEALAEQATITAALARVGQSLIASLDTPVLLERLCQVAAEVLGCDATYTLLWRPGEDAYVPVAQYPASAAEQERSRRTPVPREMLARLFAILEHDEVTVVGPEPVNAFLEATARRRQPLGARLCVALRRGPDIIGILVAARREGSAAFTSQQLRIARGIAQLASMALANARLVEELERASRLKSEFVSTMSHELRTPLNVILGFTEMLTDSELSADERREFLAAVDRASRELLAMIESTLEVGRIEAGRQEICLQSVALATFWRELEATCGMLPRASAVTLRWSPAPPDLILETDPQKLAIVLRNLVGNALKFTEHGWVHVDAAVAADTVAFRVRDTGIGIRPESQESIFEMFRQADGSSTRRYGGTGLGLYIVRRFVELLGGAVALESTPGQGSTFTVTLPRARPAAAEPRAA